MNKHLKSCDPRLQKIFLEAFKVMDISVTCGHRTEIEQNNAYAAKRSPEDWPNSKHNSIPSLAIDAVPHPTMWESREHFYMLNGIVQTLASQMGIRIQWGWLVSENIDDLAHWEIEG